MTLPVEHLSYSSVNRFRMCPVSWYNHYVLEIPTALPGWLYLGSQVHKAARLNYEQKIETGIDLPVEQVVETFEDDFDKLLVEGRSVTGIDWKENTQEFMRDLGVLILREYLGEVAVRVQPVAVEYGWERDAYGVKIIGFIDLVDDHGRVVELKTTRRKPRKDSWHEELQPTFYAFGMGGPIECEYHYMVKTLSPYTEIHPTVRTEEDIEWLETALLPPIIRSIEAGAFVPTNVDWKCTETYCEYFHNCQSRRVRRR